MVADQLFGRPVLQGWHPDVSVELRIRGQMGPAQEFELVDRIQYAVGPDGNAPPRRSRLDPQRTMSRHHQVRVSLRGDQRSLCAAHVSGI
jgi:hypothetical protein